MSCHIIPNAGIVIRPMSELLVSTKKGACRALVKKKIVEFAESKYDQAVKPVVASHGIATHEMVWYECQAHLTTNRLDAAISKCGAPVTRAIAQEVLSMMTHDVMDEIHASEEYHVMYQQLRGDEQQKLVHDVQEEIKQMIVTHVKKMKRASTSAASTAPT